MYIGCISAKKMDLSTKGVVWLGNNILTWWSSSIYPNSGILIENPMAGKAGRKNNLSVAPILQIFVLLEMYFLPMNPPYTLDVFLDKKLDNQPTMFLVNGQDPIGESIARWIVLQPKRFLNKGNEDFLNCHLLFYNKVQLPLQAAEAQW